MAGKSAQCGVGGPTCNGEVGTGAQPPRAYAPKLTRRLTRRLQRIQGGQQISFKPICWPPRICCDAQTLSAASCVGRGNHSVRTPDFRKRPRTFPCLHHRAEPAFLFEPKRACVIEPRVRTKPGLKDGRPLPFGNRLRASSVNEGERKGLGRGAARRTIDHVCPSARLSDDLQRLQRLFYTLSDAVDRTKCGLQIILLEHAEPETWKGIAHFSMPDGQWRDDNALIPLDWK